MRIFLTKQNKIEIRFGEDVRIFDFNAYYKGYYPFCRWTSVGNNKKNLYVAGTDTQNRPHVFSSTDGTVWTQVNIVSRFHLIREDEYGDILNIISEKSFGQIFLVTRNGYLVTLPDCPKCVRARRVSNQSLAGGRIEDKSIVLYDVNGQRIEYPLYSSIQYRCAWTYARPHIGIDGVLLDFRDHQLREELALPGAVALSEEVLDKFLDKYPKTKYIFFVCEHGMRADEAVRSARARGFKKSYSLGGIGDVLLDFDS